MLFATLTCVFVSHYRLAVFRIGGRNHLGRIVVDVTPCFFSNNHGAICLLNGEAIYETRPWKIYGEGPTEVSAGHHSEKHNADNIAADIRFTANGDTLYAISLGWPDDGVFTIKSLAVGNPHESRSIRSVDFISGSDRTTWQQTDEGLVIRTTKEKPCEAAYVFRIQIEENRSVQCN